MQYGGRAAFKLRAALAATMVPTYGIYTGYELSRTCRGPVSRSRSTTRSTSTSRATGRPPSKAGTSLPPWLTRLNKIRRDHPALQRLRNIDFHHTEDDNMICYSRRLTAQQSPTGARTW